MVNRSPPPPAVFAQFRDLSAVEVAGSVVVGRGPRGRRPAPGGEVLVNAPPDSRHLAGTPAHDKGPADGGAFVVTG